MEFQFSGKVGSDLGEEKPITLIRLTTQFIRVRRISNLYNPTLSKIILGNASQINCSQNSVRVEQRSDLNESDLGEVYCS